MKIATTNSQSVSLDWKPDIIPKDGTLYSWPFRPLMALKWLKDYLFTPVQLLHTCFGLVVWFFLTPSLTYMKIFSWDWILTLYIRNVALFFLVTGTVHFWLYIKKGQGSLFQFNKKGLRKNDPRFLFSDQTRENIFFGAVSGCGIWTIYEAFTYWMFSNGYILFPVEWLESPVYIIILFLLIPHIRNHHFYFTHRLLHWKPLYDSAHYLHHKNTNTGPFSGFSMHPIEHLIYLSGVIIHWIIPSHPFHAFYHLMVTGISPTWSHSGYDKIMVNKSKIQMEYYHYLHHRYFECNYGHRSTPWDRLFGTFHDGSEESKKNMTSRMRRKHR